jgi:hypothetical protein
LIDQKRDGAKTVFGRIFDEKQFLILIKNSYQTPMFLTKIKNCFDPKTVFGFGETFGQKPFLGSNQTGP